MAAHADLTGARTATDASGIDLATARAAAGEYYTHPFLLIAPQVVRANAGRFGSALPGVRPHYAVKANPHPVILQVLRDAGIAFEIASTGELDLLSELGVPAGDVLCSNPVKSREHIALAARRGVEWFVVDCGEELRKISAIAPGAKLCLRIEVPNTDSDWPLAGKFGASPAAARSLAALAAELGADLSGVSFHVGSQCTNPAAWRLGIERAKGTLAMLRQYGLRPRLLDIGGGFPVRYARPIPDLETIGAIVRGALADLPSEIAVIAEPGRVLVADAAWFVCRVIGTTTRGGRRWMHWDAGLHGGIIETARGGIAYAICTDRDGARVPWTIAGPTCDAADVLSGEYLLPEDMREGDFIYLPNTGAYTSARASTFNGFPLPEVRVVGIGPWVATYRPSSCRRS